MTEDIDPQDTMRLRNELADIAVSGLAPSVGDKRMAKLDVTWQSFGTVGLGFDSWSADTAG